MQYTEIQNVAKKTMEFIKKNMRPGMTLLEIRTLCERKMMELRAESAMKVALMVDKAQQEHEMTKTVQTKAQSSQNAAQLSNVVANITNIYDEYTPKQIEAAFLKIINKKSSSGKTEKEITRAVIQELQKKTTKSKSEHYSPDVTHMQAFIKTEG